jgi:malate synthase
MRDVACLILNTATNRWHPLVMRPSPQPSWKAPEAVRYKSRGHHTEGFDTRAEAERWNQTKAREQGWLLDGAVLKWNGEDIPATVLGYSYDFATSKPATGEAGG